MAIRPEEITAVIKKQIEGFSGSTELKEEGSVLQVGDGIARVYGRLAADKRGVAKAVVRTARPLSADAQKTLSSHLKKFAGKDVELDVKEDPELIGGVTVKIGDWVLDSSLRGQLRRLRESFHHHGH